MNGRTSNRTPGGSSAEGRSSEPRVPLSPHELELFRWVVQAHALASLVPEGSEPERSAQDAALSKFREAMRREAEGEAPRAIRPIAREERERAEDILFLRACILALGNDLLRPELEQALGATEEPRQVAIYDGVAREVDPRQSGDFKVSIDPKSWHPSRVGARSDVERLVRFAMYYQQLLAQDRGLEKLGLVPSEAMLLILRDELHLPAASTGPTRPTAETRPAVVPERTKAKRGPRA